MALPNKSLSIRVFGGPADQAGRNSSNTSNQKQGETVTTAGTFRKVRGPRKVGHFSLHLGVTEASAGGGVTVWYSDLPDPDEASDNDWVQDTTIGTLATTATGMQFQNVGNVFAEWIRIKVLPTGDSADMWLYYRGEGGETP